VLTFSWGRRCVAPAVNRQVDGCSLLRAASCEGHVRELIVAR